MSAARDDSGPAFPHVAMEEHPSRPLDYPKTERRYPGMTLRDYFAAKALEGAIQRADMYSAELAKQGQKEVDLPAFLCAMSYVYADAMLKERRK